MRSNVLFSGLLAASVSAIAFAQSAVLHDGRVVTMVQPQELFSVEGPSWNVDVANRVVVCNGVRVTIPATVNGERVTIGGSQIVDGNDQVIDAITVETFDRLLDANAATRDRVFDTSGACGTIRLGPARSTFCTSEARSEPIGDLERDPLVQRQIEDNYFFLGRNAFAQYAPGVLPASFLGMIGIRDEFGGYPTSPTQLPPRRFWRYPTMSSATFVAQGSVYQDEQGNRFNVPDTIIKGAYATLIHAENILIGNVKAKAIGNFQTPDSFVIGDTLILMNQDPRMAMDITGLGGAPVSREHFMFALEEGMAVGIEGHMLGDHILQAEVIDVPLFDPMHGAWVSVLDRTWGYRNNRLSFRGETIPASSTMLSVIYGNNDVFTGPEIVIENNVIVDPLTDVGRFDVRDLVGANPATARQIKFIVRDLNKGAVIREFVFNWADFLGL